MADFNLVDVAGWEYDLHSVGGLAWLISAVVMTLISSRSILRILAYFQLHNIPWYERSWGHLFESFDAFLGFNWPVVIVTDSATCRGHVVTRLGSIGAFVKMIKTRFGETLPNVNNILQVDPFETSQRPLRHVADMATYRKLHATLHAATLNALKVRVRSGDPKAIRDLWGKRDKTFMAIDFEWSERNAATILEWGYAAIRCGHLDAVGVWPPSPDQNYRKGHYIVAEHADKIVNKHCPTHPWEYAFGDSQVVPKANLRTIVGAHISSLASPDSDTVPNTLVLVGHGVQNDLQRLEEMKIKLPHNMLVIDTSTFERQLFGTAHRAPMQDAKTGQPRIPGSTLSFENLLRSLQVEPSRMCALHNAGNDAFMCLVAMQMLLDPDGTKLPTPRVIQSSLRASSRSPLPSLGMAIPSVSAASYGVYLTPSPSHSPMDGSPRNSSYFTGPSASARRKSWVPDELGTRRNSAYDKLETATRNLTLK